MKKKPAIFTGVPSKAEVKTEKPKTDKKEK